MPYIKVGKEVMDYGKYCKEIKPKWKEQMAREWRKESEIYIHIGMHKTATTFLQKEIFPKLKGIKYYNLVNNKGNRHKLLAIEKAGKILISDEDLSGSPLIYGTSYTERYNIADNLHKLFPNAKLIVGIRNKDDWLNSVIRHIATSSPQYTKDEIRRIFDKNYLDFEYYISYVRQLWGNKNIYVYRYEDLKENPHKFIEGICNFMDVSVPDFTNRIVNKSIKGWHINIIRFMASSIRKCYIMYTNKMRRK